MHRIVAIIAVLLPLFMKAQTPNIPQKHLDAYLEYYQDFLTHDVKPEYIETYALDNANSKFKMTYYNNVFYDQPVMVAYIRSIMERLAPGEANMEIYIARSTHFNAFTIIDGSIFVNIAALADMSSEAELAYLLGHEYAHYQLKHVKKNYLTRREAGLKLSNAEFRASMLFSQFNEFQADSLGFILASQASYDPRAMDVLTQRLIFMQKKAYISANGSYNKNDVMPSTHPIGEARLERIKLLNTDVTDGQLFPSGKERFERIKRLAEFEFLKLLDESFDLHQMITFSLKKYLSTGDEVYLPTLVRAIRKVLLVVPEFKQEGFMTVQFEQKAEMFEKDENLLDHLFYEYPDSAEVNVMLQKKVVNFEHIPFYSFEQAFNYFAGKAIDAGYEEPLLDQALHYGVKNSKGKKALTRYIKNTDNLYYDYAVAFKEGKLHENLQDGDQVVLVGGFHKIVYKKNWVFPNQIEEFEGRHEFLADLRKQYEKHELEYKIHDYLDFVQANELGKYLPVIEGLIYSGHADKVLEFDPRIYYAMKNAGISSLEYLNVNAYFSKKRWANWLYMVPPLTVIGAPLLLMAPGFFSPYMSYTVYYQLRMVNGTWAGGYKTKVGFLPMSAKRSKKIMFKTHKRIRRWQNRPN